MRGFPRPLQKGQYVCMANAESTASILARLGYLPPPHETSNSTAPRPGATFPVLPSRGPNPSPAVAEPAKPSPAALALVPAAAEVPDVWKREDKFARRGIADPTAVANPVVQVKSHLRASPGTAGEKAKQPLTLEKLVEEFATDQRQTTARALRLGRHCDAWIRLQPERPEDVKLDRPSAIKFIRRRLAEAKLDRHTARVDRYIRCYWVAQLFGGKAEELSFCSIREMQPLIEARSRYGAMVDSDRLRLRRYCPMGKDAGGKTVRQRGTRRSPKDSAGQVAADSQEENQVCRASESGFRYQPRRARRAGPPLPGS